MRRSILPLLLLLSALASVAGGAVWFIQRDRQALVEQFGHERQAQLQEATRGVAEALEDLGDDLRFAGELLAQPGSPEEHRRELRALLEAVGQYRAIAVYGPDGREQMTLVDRRAQLMPREPAHASALTEMARQALELPQDRIVPSPPVADATSKWMRVFATRLPAEAPGGGGAIAILVDTETFFAPLRLMTADENTRLLLLGFHGRPSPLSAPEVATWYQRLGESAGNQVPGLRALAARMREGESGALMLGEGEARRLGLGPADVVATFMPIRMRGEASWSVAMLSSTSALRSHERLLVLRLSLAALLVALFLVTFGAYVVLANRRAVALRESRRHADRLAHLHEKTQKILDHIPTGVLALTDGGRISAVNQALRTRLPPSALGSTLSEAFPAAPPPVVRRLMDLVAATREDGRVSSLHGEPLNLFGEKGQYNVHVVPLEHSDEEVRTLVVLEDLSNVRMLEDQLLRAEKLATVGVLAAGVAHEIGTPLGIIRGRAEYMLGKLGGAAHPQGRGLSAIIGQIDRVSRTIRQLLDFSRFQPAEARAVFLAPLVRGLEELMQVEADRRRVQLHIEVPEHLPALAADADQLQQVLLNLVLNACDACSAGGHVRLSAFPAREDPPGAQGRLELCVEDDGSGIAPEHLHQVFDPFFTTKKRGQGTGLGLTMVAQIVRNHGGQVEIDSEPGRGTRVTLRWPVAAPSWEEQRHAV
ncbi:nitrogen regulation protein NR(II) [Vitiosangium sp. GDMCC 1.1324]|uniref:two-component system sensor histidine kinase NtrB n=1 Tax=Vitiosangium sp. (strain GDMCC 1.1324) TaxID=2138576 RepID=UPI000D375756|nr:ATP-binding protein [Vitiosangium sp. GDMCC 1.1324]PTL85197.1 histidine kinase [Vitiosangium sp. GDMCC 1.1324]